MKRRRWLQASLGAGALAALGAGLALTGAATGRTVVPATPWRERLLLGFGSTLSLRVAHPDGALAERALDGAVATIRRIEGQMSLFRADSALSRLNRDGVLRDPPADLLAVLQIAQAVSARSAGSFDVTVQPLWQAFATARGQGRLPTPAEVRAARERVGWAALEVDPARIRFLRPGMGVTLNGIAQGYAADAVRAQLQRAGIEHALINTGEWSALGQSPARRPWTVGVADPRNPAGRVARLVVGGRGVATSADNESAFSDDLRHHHIFDPRRGYSPAELASVTVAAPSCALADALAKVVFVDGVRAAGAIARDWRVDIVLVDKTGATHFVDGTA